MTIPVETIHAKLEANGLRDLFTVETKHPFGLVGSFLLSAKYPEIDFGDIDVQCHIDDAETLKTHLSKLTGIESPIVREVNKNGEGYDKIASRHLYGKVDLVILNCEVLDNVREFDLTCCQNFYDGKQVHVLHPDHLESKTFEVGALKHAKRVQLYISRGFKEIPEPTLESNAPTPQPSRSESPSKRARSDTKIESELIDAPDQTDPQTDPQTDLQTETQIESKEGSEITAQSETTNKPKDGELRQKIESCHVAGCDIPSITTEMFIEGEWKVGAVMKCTTHVSSHT